MIRRLHALAMIGVQLVIHLVSWPLRMVRLRGLEAFRRDLLSQSWIGPEGVAEPSNEPLENGRGIHIESLVVSVDVAKFEASKQEGA